MECVLGASMQARAIPRVDVALAHAGDPLVGVHEHDDVVLCRGGWHRFRTSGDEKDMAFDISDLHFYCLDSGSIQRAGMQLDIHAGLRYPS